MSTNKITTIKRLEIKPLVIKLFTKGLLINKTTNEICSEIKEYLNNNNLFNIDFNNKITFYNCNSNNTTSLTQKILLGTENDSFLFLALVNLKLITKSYIDYLILKYSSLCSQQKKNNFIKDYLLSYIKHNIKDIYIYPDTNNTLFHYACQNGHIDIIKILFKNFESYEDANQVNNKGKTPYNLARDNYGDNHPVIQLLHNFKWIKNDKTKIKSLEEKINTLKRKCQNYEKTILKKNKITNNNKNDNKL